MKRTYPQKNHEKAMYEASELGKAQVYIRRFHNIKALKEAFEKSVEQQSVVAIQHKAESWHEKHTEDFIILEKAWREKEKTFYVEQEARLLEDMNKMVVILKAFEKTHGR